MSLTLTVVFGVLSCYFLAAVFAAWAAPGARTPPIGTSGWHLLMSVVMVAMSWSMWMPPVIVTIVVFTAAALWFTYRALFKPGDVHRDHSGGNTYHASMMGSMVLMTLIMAAWSTPTAWLAAATGGGGSTGTAPGQSTAGTAGMDMGGMTMPGMGTAASSSAGTAVAPVGAPVLDVLCWAAAIGFAAAAVLLARNTVQRRITHGWAAAESGAAVLMAAGMAAAFVPLL